MAELVFRVKADYEQAIKLREELNRLESEMKKVDASTKDGQDQLAQLTKEYSETGDKLKSIAEKAAEAGYVMSNEFGAKLADAKKQVIDLSVELVNAQKELDRLKNSGKATPQQIQDAEKKISDLSEALVKAEENYEDYTDSANKAGKGTKSLTEYSNAYNTIMRMLPGPIRSVVGGFRSLSSAALKFIATPLGAALLAVSAAFKGVSYWLNNTTSGMLAKQKWTKTLADTTEKWADKLGIVTKRMKELSDATASGAAAQITAYRSLQRQWEQANGVLEKQKEVLKSDEWKKLGISISGVNDAEDVLVSKSKNVVEALMARARAAAMYQKIEKEIEEQIKREDTTKADNKRKEETKSEYQKTEWEQERIVETFRQAQKDYIPSLGYSRDMKRGDDYYVTSSGEKVYRNNLSDQAWREAILRNNRALRLSHGKARQDVGFFGRLGDNGLLPAGESYDILANLYEKELDLTRGRIENLDNQIKENNETLDSYLQDIIDQMGEADSLKGVANDILSNIGANGDTTAQDENTRAIEKKRRRDAEDVELATTTARISTMKDGTEKTIAQINLNKRKEEIAIRRAYEDLREKKIKEEKKAFESNPDNKNLTFTYDYNSDKYAPTIAEVKKFLAEKNAIEVSAAKATKDALFQEEEAMYSYLKEYGNYWEKRLATVRHYNGLIERAATDGERKRLENEKEEELNRMRAERTAFRAKSGNLDDMIEAANAETREELERLNKKQEKLLGYIESATDGLKDAKTRLGETMSEMFNGNVDLTKRPQIPVSRLVDAGWGDNEPGEQDIATIYSVDFDVHDASGEMHKILVTPILADGTVLSPDSLQEYIGDTIEGAENILSADNKGIVIGVDIKPGDGDYLHKLQEQYYNMPGVDVEQHTDFINSVEWIYPDADANALARPYLDAQKLISNGWKDEENKPVFSEVYDVNNNSRKIVVTPVLPNGDVMTKEEVDNYISSVLEGSEDLKSADSLGIVIGVDIDDNTLEEMQNLQNVHYSIFGLDNKEELETLKEELLLYQERGRLIVLQNNLRIAELEKELADKYGTKADQVDALRKLIDAQSALIKDDKQRDIFKAGGNVQIAKAQYGNWRDYQTEDESIKAANAVYEAKKKELELRRDNVGLMRLEIEHSQEMFDIQMKYNKDIKSIFGNVSRYTKGQLENARNLASSILKAGKYTDSKGNTTALTQTNIKELQEAINQIDDAQFNKKFEGGSNDVLDLIKNASYLGDLRKRLAEEMGKGDKADANVIKDLKDRIEQEKEAIKKGLVSTGAAFFADSLQRSVEYMRQIAELSGDVQLSETAEGLGSFAQTLGAAAQGFASGGWIGAIVGGVQDMATQLVQSFAQATAETYKQKKNAEDFAKEMKMAALSIETEDFNSIFGSDKSGLMSEYGKKRVESLRAYNEELDKLNSQDYAPDQKQQWWEGLGMAIFGGPLLSLIDPVAGVAAPYIIGAQEKDTQAFEAYQDALSRGLTGLQTMMIKTKDQSGFANFFGVQDEYTALGDLAPELWGDDGVFSVKNAEKFLKTNQQINDEQREQIENMIELQSKVDEAKQGMKDALASVFSNTASALADATIEGLHNGATMGAADMKRILSGTAKELQKSMVESIYAKYMSKYQDEAFKILEKGGGEEDLMRLYSDMLTQMEQTIPIAQNAARKMEEMGEAMGFDMSGLQNATPSQASYQTVSETTGTAIDGRLTSLQISSGEQTGLLGMMNMSMSQMLEQVSNGARIADDVRNILTDSYLELVEIRKNTGDNVSELKLVKQMVATIEEHTRRL